MFKQRSHLAEIGTSTRLTLDPAFSSLTFLFIDFLYLAFPHLTDAAFPRMPCLSPTGMSVQIEALMKAEKRTTRVPCRLPAAIRPVAYVPHNASSH